MRRSIKASRPIRAPQSNRTQPTVVITVPTFLSRRIRTSTRRTPGMINQFQNAGAGGFGHCDIARERVLRPHRRIPNTGTNTTNLDQKLSQSQFAVARCTAGQQVQGGMRHDVYAPCVPEPFASGLNHNFDQNSTGGGLSTQQSNQDENQDQHRTDTGAMTFSQVGPVRKDLGFQSRQSRQPSDADPELEAVVKGRRDRCPERFPQRRLLLEWALHRSPARRLERLQAGQRSHCTVLRACDRVRCRQLQRRRGVLRAGAESVPERLGPS